MRNFAGIVAALIVFAAQASAQRGGALVILERATLIWIAGIALSGTPFTTLALAPEQV